MVTHHIQGATGHTVRESGRRQALIPVRTALRWSAIATLAASAAFHIPVIAPHLHEAPYIGGLFIALTVACLALAAALTVRDDDRLWAAAGVVTALAVIAYVVSRTVGLPEIGDDIGNWAEPLGVASITAETLTVLIAGAALWHSRITRR